MTTSGPVFSLFFFFFVQSSSSHSYISDKTLACDCLKFVYFLTGGTKACTSSPNPSSRRLHRLPVIDVVMTFIRFPWSRGRRRCRCPGRSATRRRSRCHWNAMSANSRSTDDDEGAAIVTRWPPSTRKTHGRRRASDVVIYDNNRHRRRRRRRRYRYQVSRST